SDIDLVVLASRPQSFRDDSWLAEIGWVDARPIRWYDEEYGRGWSRHLHLEASWELELTFCEPSWAMTDPLDSGTAAVVAEGWKILLDKAGLFEQLFVVTAK